MRNKHALSIQKMRAASTLPWQPVGQYGRYARRHASTYSPSGGVIGDSKSATRAGIDTATRSSSVNESMSVKDQSTLALDPSGLPSATDCSDTIGETGLLSKARGAVNIHERRTKRAKNWQQNKKYPIRLF